MQKGGLDMPPFFYVYCCCHYDKRFGKMCQCDEDFLLKFIG